MAYVYDGLGGDRAAFSRRHDSRPSAAVAALPNLHLRISRVATRQRSAFPELDCIRHRLSLSTLAAVERRAIEVGVGADRVVIAAGLCDEDSYMMALAAWLGLEFETFSERSRSACPLKPHQLIDAAKAGLIPLIINGRLTVVVAPRSVREFLDYAARNPRVRFRLTSAKRLNRFIFDDHADALGAHSAGALRAASPHLSAASRGLAPAIVLAAAAVMIAGALIAFPERTIETVGTALTVLFMAWLVMRTAMSHLGSETPPGARLADSQLPVYTVIAALYREAASVGGLVEALARLDYPPEKLDIKIVLEADDHTTRSALESLNLPPQFEVILAPERGPRTKPKALNAALPFARGTYTVVYDAEDRPQPGQLRAVLERFRSEKHDVACVQAALTIDNTGDGILTRLFTAEYAAQFDLFLPGLARMGLPLPLGGSSNHFRTEVLRNVGAWDPHNVTEDADLGTRIARFGYRAIVCDSTTYEEAPTQFRAWLRQRTRWFKGWTQTWCVHMRDPVHLLRQLGFLGFSSFQLVVGGNVLSALIHPLFLASVIWSLATNTPVVGRDGVALPLVWLFWTSMGAGYLVSGYLGLRGLMRRRLMSAAWALAFLPIYWLLLSLAVWRALLQLAYDPHDWEKTEHGLAQRSRLTEMEGKPAPRVRHDFSEQSVPQRRAA